MPTLNALDYSWSRPDPAAMKAAGIEVVARYLFDDSDQATGRGGKGLTPVELVALHAAGIGVVFNYEANRGNHLLGAGQGAVDGARAGGLAAALGVPAGIPIYYSCDLEVPASEMPTVLAYLKAADSPDHPSRCYAQASVCDAYGRPAWQTIAWSYGAASPHAVLFQYEIEQTFNGAQVDHNELINASDVGAWWPAGLGPESGPSRPVTTPTTPPKKKRDDDMKQFIWQDGTPGTLGAGLYLDYGGTAPILPVGNTETLATFKVMTGLKEPSDAGAVSGEDYRKVNKRQIDVENDTRRRVRNRSK